MADYRLAKTPGGREYWIVANMAVIDQHPALLASGMPIFLDIEPSPTKLAWERRIRALDDEREERKRNKRRTVNG